MSRPPEPWHLVKQSPLHGTGVFARRDIPAGTRIIEYRGKRITPEQADDLHPVDPDDPFHTFFFSLSNGKVIDGGQNGNDARWINHSCAPNCETQESPQGSRVFVFALRDIPAGDELFYDYGLVMDGRITKTLRKQYGCLCGSAACRGTMLALPKEKPGKNEDKKEKKDEKGKKDQKKKKKEEKEKKAGKRKKTKS